MWHLRIWRDSLLAERLYPNSDAKLQGHRWIRSNWPALELRANSLLLWPQLMAQTCSTTSLRLSCVCTPSLWRGFTCESSMTDEFTSFSLNKSFVNWKVVLSFNISFCDIHMLVDDGSTSLRGFNLQRLQQNLQRLLQWRRVCCLLEQNRSHPEIQMWNEWFLSLLAAMMLRWQCWYGCVPTLLTCIVWCPSTMQDVSWMCRQFETTQLCSSNP